MMMINYQPSCSCSATLLFPLHTSQGGSTPLAGTPGEDVRHRIQNVSSFPLGRWRLREVSHLLKVAELIGGRTGSVTRRILAQGVGGVGTPLHMRTRTHIHQRPEGELTAQPNLPTLSPGTVLGLWTGGKKGRCTHSLSASGSQVRTWRLRRGSLAQSHPQGSLLPCPEGNI